MQLSAYFLVPHRMKQLMPYKINMRKIIIRIKQIFHSFQLKVKLIIILKLYSFLRIVEQLLKSSKTLYRIHDILIKVYFANFQKINYLSNFNQFQ